MLLCIQFFLVERTLNKVLSKNCVMQMSDAVFWLKAVVLVIGA